MIAESVKIECPISEIAAYIDGELTGVREIEMDAHFAVCDPCGRELNEQKKFLCGLTSSLREEGELDLPENFTKLIVANAESSVTGLRRSRERYNAVFICSALLIFGLFALGADSAQVLAALSAVVEQAGAVGGFFGRILYSIFLGFAIIVRSVASQFRTEVGIAVFIPAIVAAFILYVSQKSLRTHRA